MGHRNLLVCLLCLIPALAHAAVSCTVTATGVAFGTYDPASAANGSSAGTITVFCSGASSASYTITLSTGAGGTFAPRAMPSGANNLKYNLYTSAADTQVWGDGSGNSISFSGSMSSIGQSGQSQSYTVYGLLPQSQFAAPGAYMDTITVTLNY